MFDAFKKTSFDLFSDAKKHYFSGIEFLRLLTN